MDHQRGFRYSFGFVLLIAIGYPWAEEVLYFEKGNFFLYHMVANADQAFQMEKQQDLKCY